MILSVNKKRSSCLVALIGWIAGIFTGIVLLVILIAVIIMNFTPGSIPLKNNTYLLLDYPGEIIEKPVAESPFDFGTPKKLELIKYLYAIENAASDNKIAGIIINGDLTFYPRAYAEEIGYSLERFKKSGKKIIAWLSTGINRNYSLCMYADRIIMPDTKSAMLSLTGYSLNIPYYKEGLDKLGVEFNVIHIGAYKGAFENFSRSNMSDQLRESYLSILDNLYYRMINEISAKRNIDKNKLIGLFQSGATVSMTPDEAKKFGFIDDTESYEELKDSLSKNFEAISISNYINNIKGNGITSNKIAIVYADGTISNYYTYDSGIDGSIIGAKSFIEDLRQVEMDKTVKAVIIRVNSPGGSALASELILREIKKLRQIKPVIVSFGTVAASGGYYISLAGQKIFTDPSTITGSIGVVSLFMNYEKLMAKIGVYNENIKKNKFDDFMSPNREPTDEEIALVRKMMLGIYGEFTGHVMEERKISKDKIDSLAEGRVFTGEQAIQNGLADQKGGLLDAIDYAGKVSKAGTFNIESFPKPPSFLEKLARINQFTMLSSIDDAQVKRLLELADYYRQNGKRPSMLLPFYDIP